jgi:hypothetical protein
MTDQKTQVHADEHHETALAYRKSADALYEKYGGGVRPSWVSADLEMDYAKARLHEARANEIERDLAVENLEQTARDKGLI